MSSNGYWEVDDFAVKAGGYLSIGSGHDIFNAFDGDYNTYMWSYGQSQQLSTFYTWFKDPLVIVDITFTNYHTSAAYGCNGATVYASNDNKSWTVLGTVDNSSSNSVDGKQFSITVKDEHMYHYLRFDMLASGIYGWQYALRSIDIAAMTRGYVQDPEKVFASPYPSAYYIKY